MNDLAWLGVRAVFDLMSERIEFAELPRSRAEQTFFATLMTCCGLSTEMPACSTAARNSLSIAAAVAVPARAGVAMPSAAAVRVVPAAEAMKRRVNIGGAPCTDVDWWVRSFASTPESAPGLYGFSTNPWRPHTACARGPPGAMIAS